MGFWRCRGSSGVGIWLQKGEAKHCLFLFVYGGNRELIVFKILVCARLDNETILQLKILKSLLKEVVVGTG